MARTCGRAPHNIDPVDHRAVHRYIVDIREEPRATQLA